MLDLAFEPTDSSRLGCQLRLAPHLDGLVVAVPAGAHNHMDHIPFPDR
jgi:ferredoxin